MAALLFAACGHRASQANSTEATDSASTAESTTGFAVATDSLTREDSMAIVTAKVDWPVSGNEKLVASISKFISEELAYNPYQEGKPEVTLYKDGKTAVKQTVDKQYQSLVSTWQESTSEGAPKDMTYSYSVKVYKYFESDKAITYMSHFEGFMGGAHGSSTAKGMTFRKTDGMRIGYSTEFDRKLEKYVIKDQTLFADTTSAEFYNLLKEGVRSYFKDMEVEATTDEQIKEQLQVNDVNHLPLPVNPPHFTSDGVVFVYGQYEIASYAVGMPQFIIPYDKIRPFLTEEAKELLP